jgi:flavin reductase (DIM6/NTAB) family NADH-FMN oxidoreductase RutF
MEITPQELPWQSVYKIFTGAVVPRPVGWISTLDQAGHANLAPFSFFNAVCANPPTVLFCPTVRSTDTESKDTLKNVRATGEFVVNIVTEALANPMVLTSAELPADADEFEFAGLEKAPSVVVRPPRVAASPVHFECRLREIIEIGRDPGGGSVVLGEVVHIHIEPELLIGQDKIDPLLLRAIGRLGGPNYCHITDVFQIERPPSQIKINIARQKAAQDRKR